MEQAAQLLKIHAIKVAYYKMHRKLLLLAEHIANDVILEQKGNYHDEYPQEEEIIYP